jgi:hypothetical protein
VPLLLRSSSVSQQGCRARFAGIAEPCGSQHKLDSRSEHDDTPTREGAAQHSESQPCSCHLAQRLVSRAVVRDLLARPNTYTPL